eukprot:3687-Heterococcus_DN1.PRE.1
MRDTKGDICSVNVTHISSPGLCLIEGSMNAVLALRPPARSRHFVKRMQCRQRFACWTAMLVRYSRSSAEAATSKISGRVTCPIVCVDFGSCVFKTPRTTFILLTILSVPLAQAALGVARSLHGEILIGESDSHFGTYIE